MSRPIFHIWYAYKSGLGIEVARVAPLIRHLLTTHRVMLATYHSHLYDPQLVGTYQLEEHLTPQIPEDFDGEGLCFISLPRHRGPHRCEALEKAAQRLGWPLIDESLGFPERTSYDAVEALIFRLCPDTSPISSHVLRKGEPHDKIILNLLGGAAPEKGFSTSEALRSVVTALGTLDSKRQYLIPVMAHQHLGRALESCAIPNIEVRYFENGDSKLTDTLLGSPAVMTVEGGPLHLSIAAGLHPLLLTSPHWFSQVQDVIPPSDAYDLLNVSLDAPDGQKIARQIVSWLSGQGL